MTLAVYSGEKLLCPYRV